MGEAHIYTKKHLKNREKNVTESLPWVMLKLLERVRNVYILTSPKGTNATE